MFSCLLYDNNYLLVKLIVLVFCLYLYCICLDYYRLYDE